MVSRDTFTAEVPKEIEEHDKYTDWIDEIDNNKLKKVLLAKEKIKNEGLITGTKSLKDG